MTPSLKEILFLFVDIENVVLRFLSQPQMADGLLTS
jgi:hypothetical protein